jgi:hypothetical protein
MERSSEMMKKSFLTLAILGAAMSFGYAQSPDKVEKAHRFQAPQSERIAAPSEEAAASAEPETENLDVPVQEGPDRAQQEKSGEEPSLSAPDDPVAPGLPPLFDTADSAQLEELGFRPRPCWCCKIFCCCGS